MMYNDTLMLISPENEKLILRVIEQGVDRSAAKLAAISKAEWEMRTTSLKTYAKPVDYEELKAPSQYFYGAYCQSPGAMFLALFTSRSASVIARAFLEAGGRDSGQANSSMQELAVAEISNIVINAMASVLADRCGTPVILTAPICARGARADIIQKAFGDFTPAGNVFSAYIHLASRTLPTDCNLLLMLDDVTVNYLINVLAE